jgi:hypothetical protein
MKTQSLDTSPEMEKVYFDLLRQKPAAQRARLAYDFVDETITRSRRQIARAHPQWSAREVALHWAQLMYGSELADKVRAHLQSLDG